MVTAKDVAMKAGVSQATVSYVMSGKRPITEAVQERVRKAMSDLNYYPNAAARALVGDKSGTIALVFSMAENTQMAELLPFISSIIFDARKRDYQVMLIPAEEGVEAIERIAGQSLVDGLIILDIPKKDKRLQRISKLGIPAVLGGNPDDSHGLHCVDVDYGKIADLVMDEMHHSGVKRILALGDVGLLSEEYWFANTFEKRTKERAQQLGLEYEIFRLSSSSWQALTPLDERMDEMKSGDYGVIARTPRETERVLQLMFQHRLTPGKDVSLIGVCEDRIAEGMQVPTTNVSPVAEQVSHLAVDTLFRMIDGEEVPELMQFVPPTFARRETTRS